MPVFPAIIGIVKSEHNDTGGAFLHAAGSLKTDHVLNMARFLRTSAATPGTKNEKQKQSRRKIECSKLVLWAVLCTYFAGFGVGVWAVVLDVSQLGVFLAYVGTPTATVIGFYSWKAKAENVVKIKKANPEETEGMPVDLNNVQP